MIGLAVALAAASPRVAADLPATAGHATLSEGEGLVVEAAATSAELGARGLPDVPATLRLGLAGLLEVGDGVVVGAWSQGGPWLRDQGLGWQAGGGGTLALGSPSRTTWVGFDAGVVATDLGVGIPFGVVGAVDVDPSTTLSLRGGGTWDRADGEVEARAGAGATYRFTDRDGVTLGLGWGREPGSGEGALAAQLAFHHRFGPVEVGWVAPTFVDVPAGPPAPVVEEHRHPELICAPGDVATGRPPPIGLEGWCVKVEKGGGVTRHGPYVRWHDMAVVAERGAYTDGQRSGTWSSFRHDGSLREVGHYDRDVEVGAWTRYAPDGALEEEGEMSGGEPVGEWRYYGDGGWLRTVGSFVDGHRDGRWVDLDREGREVRERLYTDGRLTSTQDLVVEPR